MVRFKMKCCVWAVFVIILPGLALAEPAARSSLLAEGTRWEMPVWEITGQDPGPTVVIVGGVHGNEPAGAAAAKLIAGWSIQRGRLIVIPSANRDALQKGTRRSPGARADVADLNRNFPTADGNAVARDDLARVLWEFLARIEPDWLIDLHEGFDFHQRNDESVGSSIIYHPSELTSDVVPAMLAAVNGTIDDDWREFVPLRPPVDGSLARAAAVHLRAETMILETTYTQPMPLRVKQHCTMVECLLNKLAMTTVVGEVAAEVGSTAR